MAKLAPFDSAWLKWAWASLKAEALEGEITAFTDDLGGNPFLRVRTEYQPKRHAFAVIITGVIPLPDHWGLLLGDVAHNFRSSLDHVAWEIVSRGSTPPGTLPDKHGKGIKGRAKTDIAFPVARDPKEFVEKLRGVPGARRPDIAVLRRYQPYARGRRRDTRCITALAGFNNIDKHRELQPLFGFPKGGGLEIVQVRDCLITDQRRSALPLSLDVGTELRTLHVRRTGPDPYLEVNPTVTASEVFGDNARLIWVKATKTWICRLLSEFGPCPVNYPTVAAGRATFK
jgi:hypothetical protein